MYLRIKFTFVCCLKLCSWNVKKEELFIKRFTPLLLPNLADKEHRRVLTNMCLCVSLYYGQMLSVCFIVVEISANLCNETNMRLKIFTLFSILFGWEGWWNQCCLLAVCKLGVGVKRPKHGCLFLGILSCTIVKWMIYWVPVLKQGS